MRAMNLERALTIVTGLMAAAVVGLYTFDLEHGLHIAVAQADTGIAQAPAEPAEGMVPGYLEDMQDLAHYQATLPRYVVEPDSMYRQTEVEPGQLGDQQMLADYQATLTASALPLEAVDGALVQTPPQRATLQQTEVGPGQLVNRQMLADYQATLSIGYALGQAVEGTLVRTPQEEASAAENQ